MKAQAAICPICHEDYDDSRVIPKILPQCGHSVCATCLKSLLERPQNSKCPYDNAPFPPDKRTVNDFKVNFGLKQLIEEETVFEQCPIHQERVRLLCLTDKKRICDDCIHFGDHKGHDIRLIKKVEPELKVKGEKLKAALDKYDAHCKGFFSALEEVKERITRGIKGKFEEFRWILEKKEAELLGDAASFIDQQRKLGNSMLKADSDLRNELADKLVAYRNIYKSDDVFSLIDEDITEIISRFDVSLLNDQINTYKQSLGAHIESFSDSLGEKVLELGEIDFPRKEFVGAGMSFFELYSKNSSKVEQINANVVKTKSRLVLKRTDDLLEITIEPHAPQEIEINVEELQLVTKAKLIINSDHMEKKKKKQNNNNADDDDKTLFYIFRKLGYLTSVEIEAKPQVVKDQMLSNIFPLIFWKTKELSTIKLNFADSKLSDIGLEVFCANIIPKCSKLKTLDINVANTKIKSKCLTRLGSKGSFILEGLEHFQLNIQGAKGLNDQHVEQFFVGMPNVKSYCLNLMNSSLGDVAIKALGRKTLSTMKNVESLALLIGNSKATETGCSTLFENASFTNLKELAVSLNDISITDTTIEHFIKAIAPSSQTLHDFILFASSLPGVTDKFFEVLSPLFLENVKEFMLHLDSPQITDKGVEVFANDFLPKLKSLKKLGLSLSRSAAITDDSTIDLCKKLPELEGLSLNLMSTKVTDKFAEELVRFMVAQKTNLKEVDINLTSANVSLTATQIITQMQSEFTNQ